MQCSVLCTDLGDAAEKAKKRDQPPTLGCLMPSDMLHTPPGIPDHPREPGCTCQPQEGTGSQRALGTYELSPVSSSSMVNMSSRRTEVAAELGAWSKMGQAGFFWRCCPSPALQPSPPCLWGRGGGSSSPTSCCCQRGGLKRRVTQGCCGPPG